MCSSDDEEVIKRREGAKLISSLAADSDSSSDDGKYNLLLIQILQHFLRSSQKTQASQAQKVRE